MWEEQSKIVFIIFTAFVIIKRYDWIAFQLLLSAGWRDFAGKKEEKNDVKQKETTRKREIEEKEDFFLKWLTAICLPRQLQRFDIVYTRVKPPKYTSLHLE